MKTSLTFTALAVILLLGAGCATNNTINNNGMETTDTETSVESNNDSTFTGSFATALQRGESLKCTWSGEYGTGTSYIKNDKFAIEADVDGRTGRVISDGECTYTWEEGGSEGMKLCGLSDALQDYESEGTTTDSSNNGSGASYQPDVDVNCSRENVNDAMFEAPTSVTFIDPLAQFNFTL